MTQEAPVRLIDPVCGMSVRLAVAEEDGLTLEHHGTLYAFCRGACRDAFLGDPHRYTASAPIASPPPVADGSLPVIDEGMRRWYDSCSCCLGDTYPEIKSVLDAERAQAGTADAGPGICEAAEGADHGTAAPAVTA
jgi:YHS domain-containing protein